MDRNNNFDILRLIFASTVIVSHSYPLTGNEEYFYSLTSQQIDLGALSVSIFFVISGYLIFQSLTYSKSISNYLWKRLLRLYPALFFTLCFTLIIVIFINTSPHIFKQLDFYKYVPQNLTLYYPQFNINHVFEDNPYPNAINGSLWTLSYEFSMYLLIIPFFFIKKIKREFLITFLLILFIFSAYCYLYNHDVLKTTLNRINIHTESFYKLSTFFISGAILSFFNLKSKHNNLLIAALVIILFLSIVFKVYALLSITILPILIILIGISFNKYTFDFTHKLGDISYGVYIYGFLVQQTLMNFFSFSPFQLTITAIPITYIIAYFSWHLVEKKAIKYKNLIS